jgi:hypothetical protein
LIVRRAPLLIERGKTLTVSVKYTAVALRDIAVLLLNGSAVVAGTRSSVQAGRGLVYIPFPVPARAPESNGYHWAIYLLPRNGKPTQRLAVHDVPGAFLDDHMVGNGTISPDSPYILYAGRWNLTDPKNPVCYWGGSQILTRFSGTSVSAKIANAEGSSFIAMIDGDIDHEIRFSPTGGTALIATGLAPGSHSLVIYKNTECDTWATFQGLVLDPGKGLLRPEPLPQHRIEFYGDSITSGGVPDAKSPTSNPNNDWEYDGNFSHTYASFTARALNADWRPISKGGSGVAGSWVFTYTLLDYWDKFNFNASDPSKAATVDFKKWQPQAVVVTIGHNDRFRAPSEEAFARNYGILVDRIHSVYPNAQVFSSNTAMSSDRSYWGNALIPLMSTRPWLHYYLYEPDQGHGGHPRLADHLGMAQGTVEWQGMANWIGDTMNW